MKKIIAVIPARYAATRFPGKLMQVLGDKPVIAHTYEATKNSGLFCNVIVVTDSHIIFDEITSRGGKAVMSVEAHESGTDRIAEVVKEMEVDVVVNVQGDEPFIQKDPLAKLVRLFEDDRVTVASLMRRFDNNADAQNPNMVKVVTDKKARALYFSRSPIPYQRDKNFVATYYLHIGVYGFTKSALLSFTRMPQSCLEQTEKLEQLRFLENGIDIFMAETTYRSIAIDTPEDLLAAAKVLQESIKNIY